MINAILGITGTLFLASITLTIIGIVKPVLLMKKISENFLLPLIITVNIILLYKYLPDSKNLMIYTTTAFFLFMLASIFLLNEKKPYFIQIAVILYALGSISLIHTLIPSFILFLPKIFFIIFISLFYLVLEAFLFFMFKKNMEKSNYPYFIITFLILSLLHFGTFINLLQDYRLYSFILFFASTIFYVSAVLRGKRIVTKSENKKLILLDYLFFIVSICAFSASFIILKAF